MEDRQCKICMQYKPLEEFELFGTAGKRSFTCRDCAGVDAPIQPAEFVKRPVPTPVKFCVVDGCDNERKPGYPKCDEHMREQWDNAQQKPREKKTTCAHEGCEGPRYVAPGGSKNKFCREHYNQYQRDLKARKRAAKPLTEAQQQAGFDRNPDKAIKGNEFKLCIIDYTADTMTFVEGRVTRKCKTDALALLPGGWQILLDGHQEDGYVVVERGTPPPLRRASRRRWNGGTSRCLTAKHSH